VARAVADHVLPHSKLEKSGNAVVAPGLVAPGLVASKFIPGNFSNVATK
jgi:hypothetical protein